MQYIQVKIKWAGQPGLYLSFFADKYDAYVNEND